MKRYYKCKLEKDESEFYKDNMAKGNRFAEPKIITMVN